MFEEFQRHGRTEVETRYSPQYRRPALGTPQEVVDATMECPNDHSMNAIS